jgi:DNA polymerase III delta subunit
MEARTTTPVPPLSFRGMAATTYGAFMADISAGRFSPPQVFAVAGGEDFLRRDALQALRGHLEKSGFTVERFDADEHSGPDLIARLRSGSLFGDRAAVLVKSVRQGNRSEAPVRFKDDLLEYLERPSRENLLIFDGETWNGSASVPKKVKTDFLVVECDGFKPWQTGEVELLITMLAARHGLKLGPGVPGALREACGGDLGLADTELQKLALVVSNRAVTKDDLAANLLHRGDDKSMGLVDAVIAGDVAKVGRLSAALATNDDPGEALRFLALLESQLRRFFKLSELIRAGEQGFAAAGKAGMNPRAPNVAGMIDRAKRLPESAAIECYRALLDADLGLKGMKQTPAGTQLAVLCSHLAQILAATAPVQPAPRQSR